MAELPIATVKRIMRRAGRGARVSEGAAVALAEILEDYANKVTDEALLLSSHAGRRTIRDTDIRFALERM